MSRPAASYSKNKKPSKDASAFTSVETAGRDPSKQISTSTGQRISNPNTSTSNTSTPNTSTYKTSIPEPSKQDLLTQERPVRIMVADDHEQRGQLLASLLTDLGYQVVGLAGPGSYLPTLVSDAKPDVILVDTDSPTRDTLEQLSIIHRDRPSPVVMFATDEDRGTIESAIRVGVSAYIVDGLNNAKVKPVIDVAIAHFKQHQTLREELDRTKTTLQERKTIDRAKGILMDQKNCSEQEAFALLRSFAMKQKKRIGEVAQNLVNFTDMMNQPSGP